MTAKTRLHIVAVACSRCTATETILFRRRHDPIQARWQCPVCGRDRRLRLWKDDPHASGRVARLAQELNEIERRLQALELEVWGAVGIPDAPPALLVAVNDSERKRLFDDVLTELDRRLTPIEVWLTL